MSGCSCTLRGRVGRLALVSGPTSTDTETVKLNRDLLLLSCFGVLLILLDQGIKWVAELLPSWPIIDATRSGSTLFSGADPDTLWATPIALIASAALIALAYGLHQSDHLRWWPVALVGAGAVGTLIDLVAFGSLRTWLIVGPTRWSVAMLCVLAALPSLASATVHFLRSPTAGPVAAQAEARPGLSLDVVRSHSIPPVNDAR